MNRPSQHDIAVYWGVKQQTKPKIMSHACHVSADCALSILGCLRSEGVTNIYHFFYILQLSFMFYSDIYALLPCVTRSKIQ